MNPFGMMFGMGPPNPFSIQSMVFEINAIHDDTGLSRGGVMQVTIPSTATELQARRMILEMAYQAGWRLKKLDRIDNQQNVPEF